MAAGPGGRADAGPMVRVGGGEDGPKTQAEAQAIVKKYREMMELEERLNVKVMELHQEISDHKYGMERGDWGEGGGKWEAG